MADTPAIAIEGVTFSHAGQGHPALDNVSLSIAPGERVAIVGPNGAGKSTLLLTLNGLLTPSAGRILIHGTAVGRRALREIRRRVGLVFQSPDDQILCPTVEEDLRFGPQQFGWKRDATDAAVERVARDLDLTGHLAKSPLQLSMGERQRVAIATVLILDPDILLLDEPTAALDPRRRRNLIERLGALPQTLVVATHDLDLALDLCPRAVILDGGEVVADGSAVELLADRSLLERHELELPLRLQGKMSPAGDQISTP